VRGAFRYHGASTGRWAGEGFQPQNLKRPAVDDLAAAIDAVATGDYEHVRKLYPRPLSIIGDCSRSMIIAAPGHVLIGADFASIESRVLAWVAGEEWKLDSYRRFDATRDLRDEPYCATACRIFGVPAGSYTKDSPERNIGKTCDLAFGYAGGLGAWRKFQPDQFSDQEVETFKNEWRAAHPAIKRFWHKIDRAA
jgi:DNA polymerase